MHLRTRDFRRTSRIIGFAFCVYIHTRTYAIHIYTRSWPHRSDSTVHVPRALRSVWSGSRLISPSTIGHNAVAHRIVTPLHRARSVPALCVLHKHTHVYGGRHVSEWRDTRGRTDQSTARSHRLRRDAGFVPISSNPQRLASLHKNNAATPSETWEHPRFFDTDRPTTRLADFCSSSLSPSPSPRHPFHPSLWITKRAGCFVAEKIEHIPNII